MKDKMHQNKSTNGGNCEDNLIASSLEATQHLENLIKKNKSAISNGGKDGSVKLEHSLAEPSKKRTKNISQYGDSKRGRQDTAGSECQPLASIKEPVNASQSFEPQKQQPSPTNPTDGSLASLKSDSDGYTVNHFHDGTNGTEGGATNGLSTNDLTANGNRVSTSALETFSSPLPVARQNKQNGDDVSAKADSATAMIQTANLDRTGQKYEQFRNVSVSSSSTDGRSNGEHMLTDRIGLTQSVQNLGPNQAPKEILQSIKQQGKQSAISNSTSCYKSGSYSHVQSSFGKIMKNSDNVKVIDFRSDTLSLPTEGMREAIYRAEVGDAVYGEDPSVLALEKKSAKLFQKEAACFLPTGTMSNLVSIMVHCNRRGSEVITGSKSHILLLEQTNVAQFGGVNMREIQNNPDGTFDLEELKTKIREEDVHTPHTSLICVENTHNVLGGKVLPQQWVDELCSYAKSVNLPVHMDGARIFSASAKLNIPVCEITRNVDTVTFCLSKNLGAPYGAVLLGTKEFINKARRLIKALGGGVRQIGFMAAAGLYALENMVERLSVDHYHVQMIANAIRELSNPHVKVLAPEDIHTNILMIRLDKSKLTAREFVSMLSTIHDDEESPVMIKSFAMDRESVRFVVCGNNSKSDVEDAIRKIRFVVNKIR